MNQQKLRTYETICITKVDMPEDKFAGLIERCKSAILKEGKGEWLYSDDWGRAKIAYTIGKDNRGRWTYFRFRSAPEGLNEVNRALGINEFVLRSSTVQAAADGSDYDSIRQNMPQDIVDREKSRDAWREERNARRGYGSGPRRDFDGDRRGGRAHELAETALPGSDLSDDSEESENPESN